MMEMMKLLPPEEAARVRTIISEREATAGALLTADFVAFPRETPCAQVLQRLREMQPSPEALSYVFVVGSENVLQGVVDLRELVLAANDVPLADLMVSPAVAAEVDDLREDLVAMFLKYHFRIIPVVDRNNRLQGVLRHKDIMKGLVAHTKT
jgi:magnesium transporter